VKNELEVLRSQIDDIDEKIVVLLSERFGLTEQVGVYKKLNNINSVSDDRERYQFKRIEGLANKYNVSPSLAKNILRLVIDEVVKNHNRIKNE
jgi:chorismate mutase